MRFLHFFTPALTIATLFCGSYFVLLYIPKFQLFSVSALRFDGNYLKYIGENQTKTGVFKNIESPQTNTPVEPVHLLNTDLTISNLIYLKYTTSGLTINELGEIYTVLEIIGRDFSNFVILPCQYSNVGDIIKYLECSFVVLFILYWFFVINEYINFKFQKKNNNNNKNIYDANYYEMQKL